MHTRDLCNHICIYTDTYVYQYMIPRRVIAIIYPGENSAKSNPKYVRARAGVRVRACVRARGKL